MRPPTQGLLESCLYVEDVARSAEFYSKIFGFPVISGFEPRGCALDAGPGRILLIFQRDASRDFSTPHHGSGELHVAFAIATGDLSAWEAWLAENAVAIEERRTWDRGGTSLYFRDPDRHLLEIATPGLWSTY